MDLFLKRPDAEEIKVNWLQDIGPIYPFDAYVPHVLLHNPVTENDCEYICLFCNNKTEAIDIIDHIISLNGGIDKFLKHEQEKDMSHRFSGHLFNIGYRNKLSQQNHVIVELNRREERKVVSFNDNSEILYGIHKDSKKINSIIKGLNSIVYNSGEMTSGGGHLYFDSSGSHIVSYWSDIKNAIEQFKSIVDSYPENAINKDWMGSDTEIKDFSYKNLLKILNKGNFIIEFKTDGFKINLSQGNSSFQMNFYIDEDGTAFNQDKNNWDTSNLTEKTFYENGNLMNEVEVDESGQANGITKKYHENGQLRNKTYWAKNIQEDGEVITYHTDGSKARKITVLNGEINGEFFEWHQNGNIKTQGTYNNGICHIEKEFDENGVLFDFKSLKFNNETIKAAVKEWLEDDKKAEAKYGHISNWDTSEVTDMSKLFLDAHTFNEPLNNWDVSKVINMHAMFDNAYVFNQPLNNWDVSKVTDMSEMFSSTETLAFNQPIGNWDVSKVTDMSYMFRGATSINQDISSWDVSSVTTMEFMFDEAKSFNQPIGNWDVSKVSDMGAMFSDTRFNQDIGHWDVSNVTDMGAMFINAKSFNQPIGDWDVSNVTSMQDMFQDATTFNQPIGNWDVSSVTDMGGMFDDASAFNQPIGNWDVSNVTLMGSMFGSNDLFNNTPTTSFNQPIGNWDVSNVIDMSGMFYCAKAFNQPLNNWDLGNVTDMSQMFSDAIVFNQPLDDWDVSSVTNMNSMFSCSVFNQDISNWDVSKVTNMKFMFEVASLFNQDLSSWSVDGVTSCGGFSDGAPLTEANKPKFTNCTP